MKELLMNKPQLWSFLEREFPQAFSAGFVIDTVDEAGVTLRLPTDESNLRPGGTISGPTWMTLADTAAYLVLLSRIGPKALAVTSSLEIHFLRKAQPGEAFATASLLKVGRSLAVCKVDLTDAEGRLCAHSTVTYSIPRM